MRSRTSCWVIRVDGEAHPNNFITRNISAQYALYVQDDWKPFRNLTINAGLRYDLQWFRDNPYGFDSLYVPSLKQVVVFGTSYPPQAIPQFVSSIPITLSSQVGLPNSVFAYLGQDKNNVSPRLGFAYEAFHNTVLRGAFGIYYNLLPASYVGTAPFANLPFSGSQTYNNSTTNPPSFLDVESVLGHGHIHGQSQRAGAGQDRDTLYRGVQPCARAPVRRATGQFVSGTWVSTTSKQNNYGGSGNYAPNINLPLLPTPIKSGSGVTVQSLNQVQPFSAISLNMDPIFHSNMNSLQIGAHHQYRNGVAFGAEYQWTRVLGTENLQNPSGFTPNDSSGPIAGIAPQVLTVNYSYPSAIWPR